MLEQIQRKKDGDLVMAMDGEMQKIADYACETGENPLWHPLEQRLYWTDIPTGRMFRFDPATGMHEQFYSGRPVGGFTIQSDGSLLLFMDRGTVVLWHNGRLNEIIAGMEDEFDSRFNDVIADPVGRVFCGTMSTETRKGRLYRMDLDGSIHIVLEDIGCSNGMAFSEDQQHFYYTDSFAQKIYRFDFSEIDGSISNQSTFSSFLEPEVFPDGCALDVNGQLWSALWGGAAVVRLDMQGEVAEKISLSVPKVSSLTFGGCDLKDMYITTAGGNEKSKDGQSAGALFRLRSDTQGVPQYFSRISVESKREGREER
jgi:D-xylonolactonase